MIGLDWPGVITNLVAMGIGFGLRHGVGVYKNRLTTIGQSAIFAGFEGPTLFVFPHRESVDGAVLPRIATEDFLAINNIISAFIRIGRPSPEKIRDPEHLTDQDKKQNNLILICSSKRNTVTGEAIERLRSNPRLADLIPFFKESQRVGELEVRWNRGIYPSESFGQQGPEYRDIAVIVKARSPWAGQRKILIVAGIRGFGTWGAAEFLKKWWQPLYDRKGASKTRKTSKEGDFAALVRVRYEDYDIKGVDLVHVEDLDEAY